MRSLAGLAISVFLDNKFLLSSVSAIVQAMNVIRPSAMNLRVSLRMGSAPGSE